MELDLSPKLAKQVYGGNGGSCFSWSPSELPMLREVTLEHPNLPLKRMALLFLVILIPPRSPMFFKAVVLLGLSYQKLKRKW
ncbi:hypothetical protein TorRG33x02_264540 [Trema orientale]|uniref:Uncharacterized protein n=1 Tax=Trema orientale TaxID=63057 RepID=A0A2P5D296_TREOI|nr:hypothetical protein TorRG33x02_264540 [Trema orientale]